jgi:sec-independent protein translocase protein TatA
MNTLASLLNLGGPDLIIILLVVLLLFGAKKLPELARGMGQAVREFSKAKDEFEREVTRPPTPEPPRQLDEPKAPATDDPHSKQEEHTPTHVA